MKVFVHLARGFGDETWGERWRSGKLLGLNEEHAYGYDHAASADVQVVYASDAPETRFQKLIRYAGRAVLGFDVVHAWRNREKLLEADVVWTHTESQTLGVLLLFRLTRGGVPKLLGQTVWLVDRWAKQPWPRRLLYRFLLHRLDVLTTHSVLNCADARELFPWVRVEQLRFGIRADGMRPARGPHDNGSMKVLSLGNDEHRDWPTLCAAMSSVPDATLRIASSTKAAAKAAKGHRTIEVMKIRDNATLFAAYEQADVVVVPLGENRHASGITVILEAVYFGVPVIATDCGGLTDYLGHDAVLYVSPGDPLALAAAIRSVRENPEAARQRVEKAQERMRTTLSSVAYAQRHVALSRELCGLA
ncbi:glycosyltransferase family 4 protein [Acetobacter sp.]|jgi:glycosyltransferase involved in cell wall biosynthesis|uniref:glycosyltransferase family 4 protein n=1 Tax=Acetobacter sp. TaxID=440 RepID=UPI0025BAB5BE|nr:glycosyltransferase family 4 protein [Acetobacter sp.]MCH4092276.1 glycosyltransferase family 4 protein [Acetobacter sp.]MCI1299807.1 glycosyltransferase family 4 protein [Acetobacter sp.]MCI1315825.1 glycosyltransferase family 4 protein [Acetobacter sp.]